jgi:superfamily II DNA or RNA helicase
MLRDCNWSPDRDYKTGTEHEPLQFYLDGLANSTEFNLLLGYFSSAAINLLSVGFATFISKGGTVKMIINHLLSEKDKDTLIRVEEDPENIRVFDLNDIATLQNSLDDYGTHFFECLAYLISQKRIQIKIIKPKEGQGIAHYKSGVFFDGENYVGYQASCNFTYYGLAENREQLEAFLSWENGRSNKFIAKQLKEIDNYFSEQVEDVVYVPFNEIEAVLTGTFGQKDINELLVQEEKLLKRKESLITKNTKLKKIISNLFEQIERARFEPHFPYPSGPREYQKEAYKNWVANNHKGIFAMATGTGKTITSLNCLLNEYLASFTKSYHALILVPTITLVNQWEQEAEKFNFSNILKISSKNKWESELSTKISTAKRINSSFIVICTYASFVKKRFFNHLKDFPSDTILIADEAHNIGAKSIKRRLKDISLHKRIGLSATPKRVYDQEGSAAIEGFFHDSEPFAYSFSMERAIKEKILCPYYYYPHIIKLTDEELEKYINITKKLARYFDQDTGELIMNDAVEKLLLQRKRIIHKAENKLGRTIQILKDRYKVQKDLKYTFIYVPEGFIEEEQVIDDTEQESHEENLRLINQYTREIASIDSSILVNQFIGGMPDRDDILDQFRDGKIQVLASMKCLDEGVDIPRAEYAIFCSSTGNPRQFIQRRGRILRTHDDKDFAVIHDLVVIPDFESSSKESDTFKTERSQVKKELERVMYFATLSENPYETEEVFKEVCDFYELDIYTIYNELKDE